MSDPRSESGEPDEFSPFLDRKSRNCHIPLRIASWESMLVGVKGKFVMEDCVLYRKNRATEQERLHLYKQRRVGHRTEVIAPRREVYGA